MEYYVMISKVWFENLLLELKANKKKWHNHITIVNYGALSLYRV